MGIWCENKTYENICTKSNCVSCGKRCPLNDNKGGICIFWEPNGHHRSYHRNRQQPYGSICRPFSGGGVSPR